MGRLLKRLDIERDPDHMYFMKVVNGTTAIMRTPRKHAGQPHRGGQEVVMRLEDVVPDYSKYVYFMKDGNLWVADRAKRGGRKPGSRTKRRRITA